MRYLLYSPVFFEKWCWRNCDLGIGGSETSAILMGEGLAARGHEVIQYAPLPDDIPSGSMRNGVTWYRLEDVDWNLPGCWVLYRCPYALDNFDTSRTDQVLWLLFQDWSYKTLTADRVAKLDRAVILCRDHEEWLLRDSPYLKGLTWITRNAIRNDLIKETEAAGLPERNPYRMMYASSPDRGLIAALKVFQRAKEYEPRLELHCTYGFNNIDKLIRMGEDPDAPESARQSAQTFLRQKDEAMALIEKTGAVFHGRLTQQELYREWFKTSFLVYITSFFETGWITGLEGQAMGAIPIYSPVHAQGENTRHGVAVYGRPDDPDTIARAAAEIGTLVKDQDKMAAIRNKMMPDVRAKWGWEQFVWMKPGENWEQAAEEDMAKKANRVAVAADPDVLGPGLADNADEADCRRRWLKLSAGDVFYDVGAGDGAWTIPAAKQGAKVYAFEPAAGFSRLDEQVEKAGVIDNVKVVEAFILNTTGGTTKMGKGTHEYVVPIVSLDSFSLVDEVGRVAMIKIDVEGRELEVIAGAKGIMSRDRPKLAIEVHTETVPGFRVTPTQVRKLIDQMHLGYTYEEVERKYQGKIYYHMCAWVPQTEPKA